jgi:hypothetical protein
MVAMLLAAAANAADDPPQVAAAVHAVDDSPKARGRLAGKPVKFPEKGIAEGVIATISLLESCSDQSLFQADEFKKAEQGDHVRLVFAKPVTATLMAEKIAVSELVFRLPLSTGVFWVRSGDTWRRYSKYESQRARQFSVWLRKANRRTDVE